MIRTTYRKLVQAREALAHFYGEKQDYDLSVLLASQCEVIWSALQRFEEFRNQLLKENSDTGGDPNGQMMIRDKTKAAAYNAAIDEFADCELTLPVDPIPLAVLQQVRLSPLDYLALKRALLLLGHKP